MIHRFEKLSTGVTQIYKDIQKLKKHYLGPQGTQVMCLYYLSRNPQGLTAARLCSFCEADKAGISRILSNLEKQGVISYDVPEGKKKYRANAVLTEEGKQYADRVLHLILEVTEKAGTGITEEEREVFYRVLSRIAGNLEQICTELDQQEKGQ